jgi:hypothetical protein
MAEEIQLVLLLSFFVVIGLVVALHTPLGY